MSKFILPIFIIVVLAIFGEILAQCIPPGANFCKDANLLCSLNELNGYTCSMPNYSNPTGCSPLCPQGGGAHNTAWWAFVTNGGNVTITITYQNCSVNGTGVQLGIWGDCECKESIACQPNCTGAGQFTVNADFQACKLYYLFVDGCSGDVCDFTITTTGGESPKLQPLGKINNEEDLIIDFCKGDCEKNFFINAQPMGCVAEYVWKLDGKEIIGKNQNSINLIFSDENDFQLCVKAIVGNIKSNSICSESEQVCAFIKIRNSVDKIGDKILKKNQYPYDWFGDTIFLPGKYRHKFLDMACCPFDSVVTFECDLSDPNCDISNNFNTIITPGDGSKNETLFFNSSTQNSELIIYDKWGSVLFRSSNYSNDWNGITNNGTELPDGVYIYTLKSNNGLILLKGTVTIKRK